MKNKTTYLTYAALIAALYVILSLVSNMFGLASGAVQVRISEALTVGYSSRKPCNTDWGCIHAYAEKARHPVSAASDCGKHINPAVGTLTCISF